MKGVIDVKELLKGGYEGKEVTVEGWVYTKREHGDVCFVVIRDGTGYLQCVVKRDQSGEEPFKKALELTQESSLVVRGVVRQDKRAPGGYELLVKDIKVIHLAEPYPLGKKSHGPAFLLDNRHLWIRGKKQRAILKVRHELCKAIREYLDSEGFVEVDAPIFITAACEGGATLFEVNYFGRKAYLSQSGQLYNEAAIFAFKKVYCFGPCFRAEKSRTRRHLTEFWQVEPEVAFATLEDILELEENLLSYICEKIAERCQEELEIVGRNPEDLLKVKPPFKRLTYSEVVEMLKKEGFDIEWGQDLGAPEERAISEKFNKPFFIIGYPVEAKAFYHMPDPDNPKVTRSADLLAPEGYGEIAGGGERIADYNLLLEQIRKFGLNPEDYRWYLDLRKYGSVPHAGFGLGIERTVRWICKLEHIREAVPFPRTPSRVYP